MASQDDGAADAQRPSSTRRHPSISDETHGSQTEESYDMTEFSVADGFRPTDSSSQSSVPAPLPSIQIPSSTSQRSQSPVPSHDSSSHPASSSLPGAQETDPSSTAALAPPQNNASAMRSRPSSISKSHRPHESLALRNDGSSTGFANRDANPGALSSGVADRDGDRANSGPSHPYQAYLQSTAGDTASSTNDQARPGAFAGPTHPYSLYPQSTAPLGGPGAEPIPVGFSGLGGTYRRQLGPDGEETGDLVGPLGHMEQLPPYTRYPEQAYTRDAPVQAQEPSPQASPAASNMASAASESQRREPSLAPAGGPPGADRTEPAADEEQLPAPRATRSGETLGSSQTDATTAAKDFAETPRGKWSRRAKTKFLGIIPWWAICLLIVFLVIVGIVMGVVLGVLLADRTGEKPDGDESEIRSGASPTVDVEPLDSLPKGLQPLATGLYDLQPLDVRAAPRTCFKEPTQSQSWNCDMPLRYYSIFISENPTAPNVSNYEVRLEVINNSYRTLFWGTQPPNVPDPLTLTLVNDAFEVGRGPAWWMQLSYDKTVLLSDSNFSQKRKRDPWIYDSISGLGSTRFVTSNPGPSPGDYAWVCTWTNVTMELFIYPNQNSSLGMSSINTVSSSIPTTTVGTTETTTTPSVNYAHSDTPAYPQVVKVLERRLYLDDNEVAATCRKVQVSENGKSTKPVRDANDDYIEVAIIEKQSTYKELLAQQERSRHASKRDTDELLLQPREAVELTDCACLWWSQ